VIQRYAAAGLIAFAITSGLFYLMQALITKAAGELGEASSDVVEFVRLKRDSEPEVKKRQLPRKQKPDEPPPPPDLSLSRTTSLDQGLQDMTLALGLQVALEGGPNLGAGVSDSDSVPVVRVNPQYPPRAAERGLEGWVELSFIISATGTVQDAEVTNSHPRNVFDRAALRAVRRWKYNPKIADGKPVERHGITVRLEFTLPDA
jgi:protein TonB